MHVDFAEQFVKPPSTIAETRITNAHNVPHRLYRRASHGRRHRYQFSRNLLGYLFLFETGPLEIHLFDSLSRKLTSETFSSSRS